MAIVCVVVFGVLNLALGVANIAAGSSAWFVALGFFSGGWSLAVALTMYLDR